MIFSFRDFTKVGGLVKESESKTAVIAFGRFNPPTSGHIKVMNSIISIAKKYNGVPMIFLSHTQDKKKNPLSYQDKLKYLRLVAPKGVEVVESAARTTYEIMRFLGQQGVKILVFVVGSDRKKDFEKIPQYAQEYNLDEIKIEVAGNRGEGSLDNVENVSASALRELAVNGNKDEFIKYSALSKFPHEAEEMYYKVRVGLGLKPE